MTATCKINSNINLEEAAKMFIEIIKDRKDIKYIEHGKTTAGVSNKNISEKKAAKKKVFYNQMTVLVNLREGMSNNIKLFNNGAISMTGLKSVEDGKKAVEIVLNYMKSNNVKLNDTIFNFGTGKKIKVIEIVKKILKKLNKDKNYFEILNIANNEINNQYTDYNKAKKLLNWKPTTNIDKGLNYTIEWYKKNYFKK